MSEHKLGRRLIAVAASASLMMGGVLASAIAHEQSSPSAQNVVPSYNCATQTPKVAVTAPHGWTYSVSDLGTQWAVHFAKGDHKKKTITVNKPTNANCPKPEIAAGVLPAALQAVDLCGTANDTVKTVEVLGYKHTAPSIVGSNWSVVYTLQAGYKGIATKTYTGKFTNNAPCEPVLKEAAPLPASFDVVDECGTAKDKVYPLPVKGYADPVVKIRNGHWKVTYTLLAGFKKAAGDQHPGVYTGKFTNNAPCAPIVLAVPKATVKDECGSKNDVVTFPVIAHTKQSKVAVKDGVHTVIYTADAGYIFPDSKQSVEVSAKVSDKACEIAAPTQSQVIVKDECGSKNDKITFPVIANTVRGEVVKKGDKYSVTYKPAEGYAFAGTDQVVTLTGTLSAANCKAGKPVVADIKVTDECGTAKDSVVAAPVDGYTSAVKVEGKNWTVTYSGKYGYGIRKADRTVVFSGVFTDTACATASPQPTVVATPKPAVKDVTPVVTEGEDCDDDETLVATKVVKSTKTLAKVSTVKRPLASTGSNA